MASRPGGVKTSISSIGATKAPSPIRMAPLPSDAPPPSCAKPRTIEQMRSYWSQVDQDELTLETTQEEETVENKPCKTA